MVMITNGSVSHGDGDTIPEDLEEDYFPPNFKEHMLKEQLKWSRYDDDDGNSGWVFRSEQDHEIEPSLSVDNCPDFNPNVCAIPKVRDNIRRALQTLILLPELAGCLVQFWAATKTLEGRTLLRIQYQPFALAPSAIYERRDLCKYRMRREHNFFYADAETGEEQLGIPGRVFLHKYLESTPDVKYYSKKEYPQLDDAIKCFIRGSWTLPVFEYSSKTCVGVLEMVALHCAISVWRHESFLHHMHDTFQEFGLICLDGYTHYEMQAQWSPRVNLGMKILSKRETALAELDKVLTLVCVIHKLPLALTWIPCSSCNDLIRGQFMSEVLEYVEDTNREDILYSSEKYFFAQFLQVSKFTHLRKGGVYERALLSPSMLYCPDITQLSIAEYPLVHYARLCKLSGLFTICLQSNYTEKEVYIVEFFLSTSSKDDENILTTLSLILGTMEKYFKTFKFASGQQLGEISSAEVMGFWNGQKLPFVQMIQAHRLSPSPELLKDRGLMSQLGQLDQPLTDAIHSGMNVVSEERNYILPSLEALQDEEATMQLDSPHQPALDSSNNGHNVVVIAEQNMIVVTSSEQGTRKRQERERKKAGVRIEISLEDILKCSEMSQKNAARELKVSPSTLNRVCREHGIPRWPPRKINMVCSSRPLLVEDQNQSPKMNSDTASDRASACVAKINLGFPDADMVTIKAKCAQYTIKFRLSSSPRLSELQHEVGKRLKLEAETYYVHYEDEENELILISCDEDLQACVHTSISLGRTSTLVLLKPKPPITV